MPIDYFRYRSSESNDIVKEWHQIDAEQPKLSLFLGGRIFKVLSDYKSEKEPWHKHIISRFLALFQGWRDKHLKTAFQNTRHSILTQIIQNSKKDALSQEGEDLNIQNVILKFNEIAQRCFSHKVAQEVIIEFDAFSQKSNIFF